MSTFIEDEVHVDFKPSLSPLQLVESCASRESGKDDSGMFGRCTQPPECISLGHPGFSYSPLDDNDIKTGNNCASF